jgi:hypothetical protein
MKTILVLVIILFVGCNNHNTLSKPLTILSNEDSFQSVVSRFQYKRYSIYNNKIDRFLVENKFLDSLRNTLREMKKFKATVLSNSFDSARQRREMMLIDEKAHFFHAIIQNNNFTKKIPMWSNVKMSGILFGFIFQPTEKNPELDIPEFILGIDTIEIVSPK